jgi:hypothetical protein
LVLAPSAIRVIATPTASGSPVANVRNGGLWFMPYLVMDNGFSVLFSILCGSHYQGFS